MVQSPQPLATGVGCPTAALQDSTMAVMEALVSFFFFLFKTLPICSSPLMQILRMLISLIILALINPLSNKTDPRLQYSPAEVSYYSSQYFEAGNASYYEREDERLHIIFLSGLWGVTPVCNRVNNTKLGKDDIAVSQGGAAGLRGSVGFALVMAVAVVMVLV